MGFTRQAGASGSDSSGSGSTTIAAAAFNLVAGRLVVVVAKSEGAAGTIDSVADTAGNTYTPLTGQSYAAGSEGRARMFYCLSATGNATNVVTVTYSSGSSAYRYVRAQSYSYDGTSSFVAQNGANANSAAADSGTATAGKMAAGIIAEFTGAAITPGSGWTETDADTTTGGHFLDRVDSPGGSISCNATVTSNYWAALIATFTDTGGDTTAPTLTSPTSASTGSSTGQGTVSTDEGNGTMYSVVSTSVTAPSVAQIQAGNDSTGSAAAWSGNQAIASTGVKTFNATGLTASTGYYFHFQHRDAATNDSTVSTSAQFTTDALGSTATVAWITA